ncbi:PF20097 family protein [Sphingomonas sp. ST-64]|uniref:PF20097 family protein n=1 Tax=Sphingomonas plantiphila TaxID=3163295 RepID=A0ABW8YP04_9SPHN
MRSRHCPKCQSTMIEGFMVDEGYGTRHVTKWVEGAPQKSVWTGVKVRKLRKLDIQTWRCRNCGYLENYATG